MLGEFLKFYLLDYVTAAKNFQVGDGKEENVVDTLYHNFCIVYRS